MHLTTILPERPGARLARLREDRRGVAMMEFALAMPIVLAMGGYGIELSNLALANMRVSQIALTLADNGSRIGVRQDNASFQLRESDLTDVLGGARLMGASMQLTTRGRVTISSLERVTRSYSDQPTDAAPVQRIHWQRCIGLRGQTVNGVPDPGFDSSFGTAAPLATAATDTKWANRGSEATGMGNAPAVTAPTNGAVIFVEVNYQYKPLFGTMFTSAKKLRYVASFIVRDNRDFSQIFNPTTVLGTSPPRSTCDKYAA